jgi:diacylglycerol O-acyltransferase / wax synthase
MTEHLTPLDATFLELEEADPSAHMHIGAVMVFEATPSGPPALQDLRHQIEERIDLLPHYRSRLSQERTGGLRWPRWEADPSFDIDDHVRRAALPAPGGRRELLDYAAEYWSGRLERDRPLWDIVLLEGLAGGRWALCTKTHHALVDGVGSVDVAHLLLDTEREARSRPRAPRAAPAPEERHLVPGVIRDAESVIAGGVRAGVSAALHPAKLREMVNASRGLVELLVRDEVVAAPQTSINVPLGRRRRFEVVTVELDELKAVKTALGGTFNDAVLAIVSGGFRKLFEHRHEPPPAAGLRAMVPVNVREASERLALGNKITSLFVHLPVAEADPSRRYQCAVDEAEGLKAGAQGAGGAALISMAGLAPPVLHSVLARSLFASRLFNVTVTNVPGPPEALYAFGARMEDVYPLVPLAADHAVGIAIVSYAGRVTFGLIGDRRAAPDLGVLREGIEDSLTELQGLAAIRQRSRARAAHAHSVTR